MKLYLKIVCFLFLGAQAMNLYAQDRQKVTQLRRISLDSTLQAEVFEPLKYAINPTYLNPTNALVSQTHIEAFYMNLTQDKQYALLNGKNATAYGIQANWFTAIDTTSSFLGAVAITKGNQNEVYGNTMRISDEYGPYLMINQKTADFKFQQYDIQGIYSKRIDAITLGTQVSYKGDYAYKQTDPRARAIASWLGWQVGGTYELSPQHEVGVSARYERHTQNVELDVWKGNIKQQFFLLRGFGMYDHDHKDHVFSKKRLYKQDRFDLNVTAALWKGHKLNVDLLLGVSRKKMKTEEETTINLYELTTTNLETQVNFKYQLTDKWQTQFEIAYADKKLKGHENRYSYQRVNEAHSGVYDYVKIGSINPYTLSDNQVSFTWYWRYLLSNTWIYQVAFNYEQTQYKEDYQSTTFQSVIEKNRPKIEMRAHYLNKKQRVYLAMRFEMEKTTKAFAQEDTSYQSLYRELYYPMFLYQSMDKNGLTFSVDYSYQIKKGQYIGTKLLVTKLWADRTKLKSLENVKVDSGFFSANLYYQF